MLLISLEGQLVLLKPCPFYYSMQYGFYLAFLGDMGIGDIAESDQHWQVLQSLINLHPRGDRRGFGFPLPDDYFQIPNIIQQIKDLNKVDPLPEAKKPKNYLDLPPESSGDSAIDIVADLANIFGYSEAIAITKELGLNQINKLITRYNEINRPKEDRAQEKMKDDLQAWAKEDGDQWFGDLGITAE